MDWMQIFETAGKVAPLALVLLGWMNGRRKRAVAGPASVPEEEWRVTVTTTETMHYRTTRR